MKKGIGLLLLILSFDTFADSSGALMLRARVPASFTVSVERQGDKIFPVIHSNRARILPKVTMTTKKNVRLVSVVHP